MSANAACANSTVVQTGLPQFWIPFQLSAEPLELLCVDLTSEGERGDSSVSRQGAPKMSAMTLVAFGSAIIRHSAGKRNGFVRHMKNDVYRTELSIIKSQRSPKEMI